MSDICRCDHLPSIFQASRQPDISWGLVSDSRTYPIDEFPILRAIILGKVEEAKEDIKPLFVEVRRPVLRIARKTCSDIGSLMSILIGQKQPYT